MGPKGEKCGDCYFWEKQTGPKAVSGWGGCHCHAPSPGCDSQPAWPDRRDADWCGEFQLKLKVEKKKA
jgi:hypothetical protein